MRRAQLIVQLTLGISIAIAALTWVTHAAPVQLQGQNMNPAVLVTSDCGTAPSGFPTNAGVRAALTIDKTGHLCTAVGGDGGSGGPPGSATTLGCYNDGGQGTPTGASAGLSYLCKITPGVFVGIRAIKTSVMPVFIRMYNSALSPSCGSSTGFVESIPIPETPPAAGVVDREIRIPYAAGIGFCITAGPQNNNNMPPPAGVFVAITYQ